MELKPTMGKKSSTELGKKYEKTFNTTMKTTAPDIKLNEVDELLTEKEQSLKKKIFSLSKMESLVFSDPKLTAVYNEMSENGEEKYGYHYNETIMNMIFNDYVLNSPKYLQKYKMAIPKKKKRRDKSGINQLKKSGEETIKKIQQSAANPVENPPQSTQETTGAASSGAYAGPAAWKRGGDLMEDSVDESTTASSAGGSAGYVGYAGPAAWGGGDLMKGKKSKVMRKPIWQGGTIIQESNYLVDSSGFEKYVKMLNEQIGIEEPQKSQQSNVKPYTDSKTNRKIIDKTSAFTSDTVKQWNKPDTELQLHTVNSGKMDDPNLTEGNENMITTKEQLKQLRASGQKITKEMVPQLAGEALYSIAISLANKYIANKTGGMGWNELADTNSMWDYINDNGGMTYSELMNVVKEASDERLSEEGFEGMFDEGKLDEKAKSKKQQQLFGIVRGLQKGEIDPSTVSPEARKMAKTIKSKDVKDFASTKHKGLPTKVEEKSKMLNELLSLHDTVEYVSDMSGEEPFMKYGEKWQFVWGIYPNGKKDIAVYRFATDLTYDYNAWNETFSVNENDGVQASSQPSNFYQNLDPQKAVEKATVDYIGAMKKSNKQQADKIAGNLKSHLDSKQYDWKKDPYAMEILGDFLQENSIAEAIDPKENVVYFLSFNNDDIYWKWINGQISTGDAISMIRDLDGTEYDPNVDYKKEYSGDDINETDQSMIADTSSGTIANKMQPAGTVSSGNVSTGLTDMKETIDLFEELNKELDAYSIHHNKLMKMTEDRKPSALVLKDRLGAENKTNFKKDLQHSGTKEIIDVEKELMYKDQQTDVGKDPQKLGLDIEKNVLKTTKGQSFKNVGDSTNNEGNEIPKRNLTSEEQKEVDMYRLGQQDWVYDNEPSERFEERMKKDMGDTLYQQRQDKMEFRSKAPMYNKDTQPTEKAPLKKVQFNKEESGWNEREGLEESMITGRFRDALNKSRIIDFTLNEVQILRQTSDDTLNVLFPLDFTGLGNAYVSRTHDYKVSVNESVVNALDSYKFYTNGKKVFAVKNSTKNLNENENKDRKVVNEQVDKMKHLLGYKPNEFVNTNNVKKNRGF